jgi:hypothetical protein
MTKLGHVSTDCSYLAKSYNTVKDKEAVGFLMKGIAAQMNS